MMNRRKFILAATTTSVVGLAGCLGDDDPDDVAEAFYTALGEGDAEAANDLIHEESPEDEVTDEDVENFEDIDITVEETEIVEEDDDVAEVRTELTLEYEGEEETIEETTELRTEDGEWKIYE